MNVITQNNIKTIKTVTFSTLFTPIHVLNMPCAIGQQHQGVALTNQQLIRLFPNNKHQYVNIQKVNKSDFSQIPSKVLLKCIDMQKKYNRTLFFGGDHYASFFTILSSLVLYGNNFRLIWLDAHGDIHNKHTSPSGNKHGMPIRFALEHILQEVPILRPEQILYIGVRDLENTEWNYIHRRKIQYIKSDDVSESISKIAKFVRGRFVHISLDVDVLDPSIMPCTGTPVSDGLCLDTLFSVYDVINKNSKINAIDIMEYCPTIGSKEDKKIAKNTIMAILDKMT